MNIDTNAIISVAKPRIGNKSKEVLKPEDRPGYFENRFLPALIAEIEGLAALTGTRAIVFLSRTAQMETLHAWERVLIGKSGSDAITPEDHNRLDAAGEQGDPNREPGYARKAMRELVTKLKASPSVEYHEETRDHGMVSLAAKDDALGREQVAVQLLSLRAIYLDVLQAMDTEIERDGESERELLDQIDVAVDLLDAGDELADKDIATLKQTIRQIASAMPNHPQDDLLALVASLQIGHTLEEAPLSCDSTIIYEFLDLVKSKEGAKESAGRNIAAVCLTADQLAAHLWSQADPTKIAAVPLEQGKYDFALADNVARAATGGRVYSDVFLFDDIENPDENVLLNDKDVEKPDGPVREAMRLCLRSLVAVSLAHLVDHDKASVGEEPQPEVGPRRCMREGEICLLISIDCLMAQCPLSSHPPTVHSSLDRPTLCTLSAIITFRAPPSSSTAVPNARLPFLQELAEVANLTIRNHLCGGRRDYLVTVVISALCFCIAYPSLHRMHTIDHDVGAVGSPCSILDTDLYKVRRPQFGFSSADLLTSPSA